MASAVRSRDGDPSGRRADNTLTLADVTLLADPAGALFGVGDGIRHRAGGDFAVGFDLPLHHGPALDVYATVEAVADWFPDPRGPSLYALGSAALGVSHSFF